jgi:squalene synthase HpnC
VSDLDPAYARCAAIARGHYENFPVASWLLPARLRRPVTVVYAYSRSVDDLADEGDLEPAERLARLAAGGRDRERAAAGEPVAEPVLAATGDVIRRHRLPTAPFLDLIRAFRQDVVKHRYADHGEVLDYCTGSANPVGRILLHLAGQASPENLADSDRVCTALQLINFLQDLEQDYHELGRIYLPADAMARHGVTEDHLRERRSDPAMAALFQAEVARARDLLLAGAPLAWRLPGLFGLEIRLIVAGGLRVADRLAMLTDDVFARPRLSRHDRLALVGTALRRGPPARRDR